MHSTRGTPDGSTYTTRPITAAEAAETPPATIPGIQSFIWADSGAGERDQPDLSDDSRPAISAARARDPHREAGTCPMTIDLYQPPLRYGDAYDELVGRWDNSPPVLGPTDGNAPSDRPGRIRATMGSCRAQHSREWDHLQHLWRPARGEPAWRIDVVPLLIPADEWRFIEAGVIQRAQLLNRLLKDLYGAQNLLTHGLFSCRPSLCQPRISSPTRWRASTSAQFSTYAGRRSCPLA